MAEVTLYKQQEFDEIIKPIKIKALSLIDDKTFIRECSWALQSINSNKLLLGADKISIMQAVYNVVLSGLTLNPVQKQAYLIPRWTNGKYHAVLEPDYRGLVKLITDTGSVKNIYAYPVYDGDEFEEILGTSVKIIHKPKHKSRIVTHVYAIAILPDDSMQVEVMTAEEINEIRGRSESYKAFKEGRAKSCIWESDYAEMSRKTVIKRITKYLPKTEKWENLSNAIDIDNSDYKPTYGQITWLEQMVKTSAFDDETKQMLCEKLNDNALSHGEFETMKNEILNNQLDRISSGMNYTQTDIKKKIENEIA